MLSFNLYFIAQLQPLVSSCTLFPQLVERWTCVSSPLLSHTPHRRRTGGSRGATQRRVRLDLGGVSQLTLWRQGWTLVCFIFIFYFVRLLLCNKYFDYIVTFISIHCYYMCCLLWHMYETNPALSLKPGCDRSGIRGMLIVGRNLDRTGQPLSTYLCYSDSFLNVS
jgi:hypothetical protein